VRKSSPAATIGKKALTVNFLPQPPQHSRDAIESFYVSMF